MNDAPHSGRVMNTVQGSFPVEPREQIIGKQGFNDPDHPMPGWAGKFDSRVKDLDVLQLRELARRNVLMTRLRTQAKPCGNTQASFILACTRGAIELCH